jgi:hypothetical protein
VRSEEAEVKRKRERIEGEEESRVGRKKELMRLRRKEEHENL